MIVLWILFLTGLIGIPAVGLLLLRWAARNGEFRNLDKIALSIFNDEEPVGEMTDHFPAPNRKIAPNRVGGNRSGKAILTPDVGDSLTDNNRSLSRIRQSNSDGKLN